MKVCRRRFLSGSTVAALAAAGGCCTVGSPRRGDRTPAPWLEADVVVAGGGPAGVCAAVSAARMGAKTILVERFGCLGGNLTLGHVSPILGKVCPGTMADEIRRLLNANHLDAPKVMTRNGPEEHIDHEEAKGILARLCANAGVTVLLCAPVIDAQMDGTRVTGLTVDTPNGRRTIRAKVVIDATGDGRVATAAGAEVKIGRDSDGATQPSTLEFVVDGLHRTFYPGERSVNATQINGIDPLNPIDLGKAEVELRGQIDQCVDFLRKYVPGFEKCRVKSSAGTLGVRETRRVMGDAMVVDDDLLAGRHYPDAVVHDAWFLIDIHNPKGGGQAEGHSHPAQPYDIRYGAFLPKGIEGLLTAGRCFSGTHRSHASYRVMTPCMAMGEAVGVAAALAAKSGITPRAVKAEAVRQALIARGVKLADNA